MSNTFYKLTDAKGNNLYSQYGTVNYEVGKTVEVTDFDASDKECNKGLHVCMAVGNLFRYTNNKPVTDIKVWEISVEDGDIIDSRIGIVRVKKLKVIRELNVKEIYGPNHAELFEFLEGLPKRPYDKPAKDLDLGLVEQLVSKHLEELSKYAEPNVFSGVMVKFVRTEEEYNASIYASSIIAPDTVYGAAEKASYNAAKSGSWNPSCALGHRARCIATFDAACDIVANTGPRPWMPLAKILALGCVPVVGLVNNKFIVWIPQESVL